jgi:hypothetical protein
MSSSEITQRRGDFQNIVYLLFGGSFLGITLMMLGSSIGGWMDFIITGIGIGFVLLAFYLDKRSDLLKPVLILMDKLLDDDITPIAKYRWLLTYYAKIMGLIIGCAALALVPKGLAALAGGGTYDFGSPSNAAAYLPPVILSTYLPTVILWLLLGVPHRAFKYELDRSGEGLAQHVLLKILTVAASILTGIYVLMLHFSNGPLHGTSIQVLIPGIIFTTFLILPAYKSLSKACWQRGIRDLFSPKIADESLG